MDIYAAIVVPGGNFYTINVNSQFSAANEIIPFMTIPAQMEANLSALQMILPEGLAGNYVGYIIAVKQGSDAANSQNWIDFDYRTITIE